MIQVTGFMMRLQIFDRCKRAVDVGASAVGLLAVSPVLLVTAAAVRTTLGSPVLYKQERPGVDGVPFYLYKFRTMKPAPPGEDDIANPGARITALGQFLRSTSLDELPTLFNVLRGDMSLVGPRPLLMRYLDRYTPEQTRRHEVRPGITGWAQVNGRNNVTWEQKFAYDVWYVDHRSVFLDVKILAMTALKVVQRDGISREGYVTAPEFMGISVPGYVDSLALLYPAAGIAARRASAAAE